MHSESISAPFVVQLAVVGTPATVLSHAVPDLHDELDAREYLTVERVEWDTAASEITIEVVEYWEDDPQRVAAHLQEELSEIMAAVLNDFEHYRVEIRDVRPLE